jgi:gamma-glutamyltranspeptidase
MAAPSHAIATPERAATEAGRQAFAAGGNAVDAALAAAAALTVSYPHNCALGGDLFALVREPGGRTVSLNASGPAGAGADAAALRRAGATAMPASGAATVTVPGLVAGWERLHALGAARPWADALAPAIALARDGARVTRSLAAAIEATGLGADLTLGALLAPGGVPLAAGDVLRQPVLAGTLERLARDGAAAVYDGPIGAAWLAALAPRGGALTAADLRGYAVRVEPPLRGRFGERSVLTSPPGSSGLLLLQALAALDAAGAADPLGDDAGLLGTILRLGGEARDRELGERADPAAWLGEAAVAALLERARRPPAAAARATGPRADGDTAAVVAVDGSGRAVALVQSLFSAFGARILDPATGVLLHNRGAFFSLTPGHPNELLPGRRPVHTLMPAMVEREGALEAALATMGGRVHAQILVQVLLRRFAGASPQAAVDAPRWTVGGMGLGEGDDTVRVEAGCDPAAVASLERAGLRRIDVPHGSEALGHAQLVTAAPPRAGSDRRADGAPG